MIQSCQVVHFHVAVIGSLTTAKNDHGALISNSSIEEHEMILKLRCRALQLISKLINPAFIETKENWPTS